VRGLAPAPVPAPLAAEAAGAAELLVPAAAGAAELLAGAQLRPAGAAMAAAAGPAAAAWSEDAAAQRLMTACKIRQEADLPTAQGMSDVQCCISCARLQQAHLVLSTAALSLCTSACSSPRLSSSSTATWPSAMIAGATAAMVPGTLGRLSKMAKTLRSGSRAPRARAKLNQQMPSDGARQNHKVRQQA